MEKDSTTVKAVEKFMEVKFENKYRVNLTKEDYFEVDSFLINGNRFVNIRSIHGRISGKDFSITDPNISEHIKSYLRYQNNVELINILSRELNKFNYFEIYDKSKKTNAKQLSRQEILNESSHGVYTPCGYINEIYGSGANNLINPEKLYKHLDPRIFMFTPVDYGSIDFYPIWFFDGNRKSKYTKLTCHFDILVHILSKVFVIFKVQILKLASTDIQIAKESNQTVEDYSEISHSKLVEMLKEKDIEISTLRFNFAKFREESDRKHEELMNKLAESNRKHDETIMKLDESKRILEETRRESNQSFADLHASQEEKFTNLMTAINGIFDGTKVDLRSYFTTENLTSATAKETFIVMETEELKLQFDLLDYLNEGEIILDTIVCQTRDIQKNLDKHDFDEETDRIIFQCPSSNSLDIFKFISENIDRNIARVYSSSDYIRKIIVNESCLDEFVQRLRMYVDSVIIPRNRLTDAIGSAQQMVSGYIQEKIEESSREFESKMFRNIERRIDETVTQQVQQVRETVQETVTQARQEIREEIQETQEQVRTIQGQVREIEEAIADTREEVREEIQQATGQIIEEVVTEVREVGSGVREEIQTQVQQVREEINRTVEEVNRTVEEVNRTVEEVVRTVEEVVVNRLLQYINQHRYRKIFWNHYYRDIHFQDGKVYVYPYKESNRLEEVPDIDDLSKYKFKR